MRAVVQRVSRAEVRVEDEVVGRLDGPGLVVLLGVTHEDTTDDADRLAAKIVRMRIMAGERSVDETGGGVLAISQFTLYADTRKGRRPSWGAAAPGPVAEPLYERFCAAVGAAGVPVERGVFGADMAVDLVNDGPVTMVLDS
ncbi:D-tyrosyl-tRNA(Tyr) deacylase [Aeromicrobium sp. 636]|uniref:D-aminoacyl-tRNA deacylase n=1 Tax=Aeromicrobium senzhongii TaxID=2663859 RepID=A0A8I0EX18_9ACTN|nr:MULTISPECIES: D-aminoacyl-tRNA deacylase [Aeromicrobium]MBC9227223.1 D-tyrosyl-tRNA(Tyr) deacylase [Aeromicrobium senzhongii]MCQ3999322.1 D-tyrosyl-tRNA(Tyr) deacylase [Aeromicrobium sp. 636]